MSELTNLLSKIGMNEKELKIYETIVAFGFHTAGQISSKTDLTYDEIVPLLDELVKKNFLKVKEVKSKEGRIFFPMAPKIAISSDLSQNLSDRLKSLSSQISEIWANAEKSIDGDTEKLISEIKTLLEEYANKIDQLSTNNMGSITTWAENSEYSVTEVVENSIAELKKEVTEPLVEISKKMTALSKEIQEKSSDSITSINSKTEQHQKSIETAVTTIKDELGEFADEVGFIISGRISGLNQIIEDLSSASSDSSEKIIQSGKNDYTSYLEEDKLVVDKINIDYVSKSVDQYKESAAQLQTTHTKYRDDFGNLVDVSIQASTEIKDKTIILSKKLVKELDGKQLETVENLQIQFSEAVSTVQEKAVSQLGEILDNTKNRLGSLNDDISAKLNQYQGDLGVNLNDLTGEIENNLNERFSSIEEVLTKFIDTLKNSTKANVSEANKALLGLKVFLEKFLKEVETNFGNQLNSLTSSVSSLLGNIVKTTSGNLDATVSKNTSELDKINNEINTNLSEFQESIKDFLQNSKSDLQQHLSTSQKKFKEGVDIGVNTYQEESTKISDLQTAQLGALAEEATTLSEEASKARGDALQAVDMKLNEIKSNSITQLNDRINTDVDKISRELERHNEKLERDLRRFSEEFHDNTLKLREDVPQSVENMFLGQTNQLEGIRRQFDSNRRFISEFFVSVENDLPPGEKTWKKKDFQTEFYARAQRIRSDFDRFQSEFQRYLDFALDDTQVVKNELLSTFNRTIQDEVANLDELVSSQSELATRITKDFLSTMDGNKSQLNEDMTSSVNDSISELISEVRKTLLTKFEQPLESIISKAQAVATGSEGVDQENRIIKSQNLLISKINEAVETLASSLQTAFEESVADLDNKVEESINNSTEIIGTLNTSLSKAVKGQKSTINSFSGASKNEISAFSKNVNDQIVKSTQTAKAAVTATFKERSEEVNKTVLSKTGELDKSTKLKLTEVDKSLQGFKSTLNEIKTGAYSQISKTITHSVATQKNALDNTVVDLSEATEAAKETLSGTRSSLDDNVGTILSQIQTDVVSFVDNYKTAITEIETELVTNIDNFFNVEAKLGDLETLKSKVKEITQSYGSSLKTQEKALQKDLESAVTSLAKDHNAKLDGFSTKYQMMLSSLADNHSNFILDLFDQVSDQISSVQTEVLGSIENAKGNIDNTVTNSIETVRTDILNPANEVVTAVGASATEYAQKIGELSSHFSTLSGEEETVITRSQGELLTKLITGLNREKDVWQQRGQDLYGSQSSTLHQLAEDFEKKVTTATTSGKEAVSAEISKIPTVVEDTLDAAARSMALLNEISKGAIDLDPQTPDTSYFDVGKEAIIANLNGVLSRTKSSVTIVTPTISWLDPELIPGFTRASVRIILDADQLTHDDNELIEKFKQHNVSVSLRRLDRNRYRQDLNMIMAARDKEEVILSKLLSTSAPYAFVSQDEYFIEKFAELTSIFLTMPEYKP